MRASSLGPWAVCWSFACGAPPGPPAGEPATSEVMPAGLAMGEVHASVDFTRPGAPTGDLIGWNLGRGTLYAPEGDPLHPEWRTPARVAAVAALAATRPAHGRAPLMRFSGLQIDGARGQDGYHFRRFVEPGRAPAAGDDMASFEVFALMQEADAAPIITLNFGSGTASEAAGYVRHLNGADPADPDVAARVHWGAPQPYRQALFELGNEPYGAWSTGFSANDEHAYANPAAPGGGDPAWHGRPSASAADFAARGLEYVAAVRAAWPQARLWVPLAPASMETWGGVESAAMSLGTLLKDQAVAGATIHHYLLDDAGRLGLDDPDDAAFVLGGTELFRPLYQRARAAIDAVRPGLPLVVTEYHVAGASSRGRFTRGDQAIVGLGVAEMLIFFAQVGVDAACQQLALEFDRIDDEGRDPLAVPWFNPFRAAGGGVTAMAAQVTTRLVADHLLERAAPIDVSRQVRKDMTVGTRTIAVPLVHAVAFVDADGGAGSVVLLHREAAATRTLTLDVPEGWTATAATEWAPPAIDHDTRARPVAPAALAWAQEGARVQVTLRPHSLVALRFAAP